MQFDNLGVAIDLDYPSNIFHTLNDDGKEDCPTKGLQFRNIEVTAKDKVIISGITGRAEYGKVFVIMGPSGKIYSNVNHKFI